MYDKFKALIPFMMQKNRGGSLVDGKPLEDIGTILELPHMEKIKENIIARQK